jgi:hypothetical protein
MCVSLLDKNIEIDTFLKLKTYIQPNEVPIVEGYSPPDSGDEENSCLCCVDWKKLSIILGCEIRQTEDYMNMEVIRENNGK